MTDPIMIAVAGAVAGKAAESLTEQGREAVAALVRLVRRRFADRPEEAALVAAREQPGDQRRVHALAAALAEIGRDDPDFLAEVRALWERTGVRVGAEDDGVVNLVHGEVGGNVVQARDVHGDINLGS